jgi:hypothetical protein
MCIVSLSRRREDCVKCITQRVWTVGTVASTRYRGTSQKDGRLTVLGVGQDTAGSRTSHRRFPPLGLSLAAPWALAGWHSVTHSLTPSLTHSVTHSLPAAAHKSRRHAAVARTLASMHPAAKIIPECLVQERTRCVQVCTGRLVWCSTALCCIGMSCPCRPRIQICQRWEGSVHSRSCAWE